MSETTEELRVSETNLRDAAYDLLELSWHAEVFDQALALKVNPDGDGAPEINGVEKSEVVDLDDPEAAPHPSLLLTLSNGQRFAIDVRDVTL